MELFQALQEMYYWLFIFFSTAIAPSNSSLAATFKGTVYCGFASGLGAGFSTWSNGTCMVPTSNVVSTSNSLKFLCRNFSYFFFCFRFWQSPCFLDWWTNLCRFNIRTQCCRCKRSCRTSNHWIRTYLIQDCPRTTSFCYCCWSRRCYCHFKVRSIISCRLISFRFLRRSFSFSFINNLN